MDQLPKPKRIQGLNVLNLFFCVYFDWLIYTSQWIWVNGVICIFIWIIKYFWWLKQHENKEFCFRWHYIKIKQHTNIRSTPYIYVNKLAKTDNLLIVYCFFVFVVNWCLCYQLVFVVCCLLLVVSWLLLVVSWLL